MDPIVVRASLAAAAMLPEHPIALDALLMAAYAARENLPPLSVRDGEEISIPKQAVPLQRSACGRIYLASTCLYDAEEHERRFLNKRFPVGEAQSMGDPKLKRINLSAGLTKGYRIPMSMTHVKDDAMIWYALGDADAVRDLVSTVGYLGKKRSVGLGRVREWRVEPCEPWEGFPVLLEGRPLRSLPLDWPGLGEHRIERRVLAPPYWERWRAEECAVA